MHSICVGEASPGGACPESCFPGDARLHGGKFGEKLGRGDEILPVPGRGESEAAGLEEKQRLTKWRQSALVVVAVLVCAGSVVVYRRFVTGARRSVRPNL
jgi:hypothetical protein